ncbi:MAG TPA: hypothetical protein VHN20_03685, partial [Beijerinckiaceae bacterium]|nr:hypothetical protein [Beijerinckiaceae bacterium]
ERGTPVAPGGFVFHPDTPEVTVREILDRRPELSLALSRNLPVFRGPVVKDIMTQVSKENALFSVATALPYIMPLVSLPWAIGEFASDTAFLTINQIRMAFMLAAASDCPVGFREQKAEVASIVAGAFGWRAISRELVGKIPMGGGLLPKAAIAYAGTFVAGLSLERLYNIGYGLSEAERKTAYERAYDSGKQVAESLVKTYTRMRSAS